MDNKNDIERNRQLRRIADALEKIAKNMQKPKPHEKIMQVWNEHAEEDNYKGTIGDTIHDR